ncbi:aldehyde dehydrogenase family protein [Orenia marismortui]|uniref:aldehyde dehydrogenase family protein n=1 Tax=Orenia marismortui TaxID=46469 RepID=UPI00035F5FA7|nr:aldehyde dehydrogenase family protein [Orenia marismortui]
MSDNLISTNPINGKVNGVYPKATINEIKAAKIKAKQAFGLWRSSSLEDRIECIRRIKELLINDLEEIIQRVVADTGKVNLEALMSDILPTLEIIKYYEKNAKKILEPQKRKNSLLFFNHQSYVEYKPLGIVAIISPWNFPLQLSLVPAISALLAGNVVLLKPSEITPLVGNLIQEIVIKAKMPANLIQVLQGGADTGEQLIKAEPDKIFFTGSVVTGKKIMAKAAENLIPVELELGGKDPMIVFADANFNRAVEATVYGAFANTGQYCVSIERVYVEESIYNEFVSAVVARTNKLKVGSGLNSDIGAITYPKQLEVIKRHISDAVAKGAELMTEIKQQGNFFSPIVLKDVNHEMLVMQEETFGPVVAIMPFKGEIEAINLANDSDYGLNSSVWSNDLNKAKRVVNKLKVGNNYINDVLKNIGNPDLPFGGVKNSGIAKYHGPEGLHSFSIETAVSINKSRREKEFNFFPYSSKLYNLIKEFILINYSDISLAKKLKGMIKIIFAMIRGEDVR